MKKLLLISMTLSLLATTVFAQQATKEDAVNLVKKAAVLLQAEGDSALAKISDPAGEFYYKQKALYVFVYNKDCVILAHPYKKDLIGKSLKGKRDARGKKFRDQIVATALQNGSGWTEYTYQKPGEKGLFQKIAYCQLVEKNGIQYIVVSGIYK